MRNVIRGLRDIQDQRLERLLLGVGREVRTEVDTLTVELMTGVAYGGHGLTVGGISLEGSDDLDRGEALRARHLRRQVAGHQLSRSGVTPARLDDGIDVEGFPEASLAITNPPLGEVGLGEVLAQREFDHRAGGFSAARESERGEVALEFDIVQLAGEQAGADIADSGGRVQAPGEPRVGRGPFESRLGHGLGDSGMDDSLTVRGSKADGLEVGAILAVKLLGNRHERGDGGRGLEVAQGDGDLAAHGGGLIPGHGLTEREDIATGGAESAEGHEAAGVIRRSEFLASERDAFIAELREQPDGAGSDERIGVSEERRNIVDDLVTCSLEAIEASGADVRRRITQSGDLASSG